MPPRSTARLEVEPRTVTDDLLGVVSNPPHIRFIATLNTRIEEEEQLPEHVLGQLWHDWLWASDPAGKLMDDCAGMNGMHMRGLLVARALSLVPEEQRPRMGASIMNLVPDTPSVHLYEKPIEHLTARELRDTLEACQLHTAMLMDNEGVDLCHVLIMKLYVRFGTLASHACSEDIMDDKASCTAIPTSEDNAVGVAHIYTVKAMRTHIDIFYVLLRAIEIVKQANELEIVDVDNGASLIQSIDVGKIGQRYVDSCAEMVKSFHVESSIDAFNTMQQMFFLSPAQRLVYSHNFAGMFNDISQVTYFHYPDYVREGQVKHDEMVDKAMNALPCVGKLVPQLKTVYDDEFGVPLGRVPPSDWMWVVSVGQVYLWDAKHKKLWRSSAEEGAALGSGGVGRGIAAGGVCMTDFSHVRLVRRRQCVEQTSS